MQLTNLSFEEWIEHAFSREVLIQQAAWYFDPNQDFRPPKAKNRQIRLLERAQSSSPFNGF
jgi:hypothetical protein